MDNLPERVFKFGEEPDGERVHKYFQLQYLNDLAQHLGEVELEKIRSSRLGKLFDIGQKFSFSNKLCLFLLTRQLVIEKKHEIWFLFAGKPIRFSLREFASVTGLRCDPIIRENTSRKGKRVIRAPYWFEMFAKNEEITPDLLVKRIKCGLVRDSETRLKYALLILIDGVLCPLSLNMKVQEGTVELLRDVDQFLNHPWGRVSFEMTMKCIKSRKAYGLAQASFAVKGFVHALQLVLMEAVPDIERSMPVDERVYAGEESEEEGVVVGSAALAKLKLEPIWAIDQEAQVHVQSIIAIDDLVAGDDFSWSDEVEDPRVDYLVRLVEEGHEWADEDFVGGAIAPTLGEAQVEGKKVVSTRRRKKSPAAANLDAPGPSSQMFSEDQMEWLAKLIKSQVSDAVSSLEDRLVSRLKGDHVVSDPVSKNSNVRCGKVKAKVNNKRGNVLTKGRGNISREAYSKKKRKTVDKDHGGGEVAKQEVGQGAGHSPDVLGGGDHDRTDVSGDGLGNVVLDTSGVGSVVSEGPPAAAAVCDPSVVATDADDGDFTADGDASTMSLDCEGVVKSVVDSLNNNFGSNDGEGIEKEKSASHLEEHLSMEEPLPSIYPEEMPHLDEDLNVDAPDRVRVEHVGSGSGTLPLFPTQADGNLGAEKLIDMIPRGRLLVNSHPKLASNAQETTLLAESAPIEEDRLVSQWMEVEKYFAEGRSLSLGEDLIFDGSHIDEILGLNVVMPPWVMDAFIKYLRDKWRTIQVGLGEPVVIFQGSKFAALILSHRTRFEMGVRSKYVFDPELMECIRGEFDSLYFPFNFDQHHWVGICADMRGRYLYVFDCNQKVRREGRLRKELQPLAEMLPYVVRQASDHFQFTVPTDPFIISRDSLFPTCLHPAESGMLTVLFIEKHALYGVEACREVKPEDLVGEVKKYIVNVYDAYVDKP